MSISPFTVSDDGFFRRARLLSALVAFICAAIPAQAWIFGTSWPTLTQEEMALTAPTIDPEAGAEILYREVTVTDIVPERRTTYFNRVKIFDERGVEEMTQIELTSWDEERIRSVKARIIRPDGSIEELEREAVRKQGVMKLGHYEANRTSFALPGLIPGCIVDYKWSVVSDDWYYDYRLFTRVELPTHRLRFRVQFAPHMSSAWTTQGVSSDAFKRHMGNWYEMTLEDLPAQVDEPYRPPSSVLEPWIAIYYLNPEIRGKNWMDDFWEDRADLIWDWTRKRIKPRVREIREKAAELTAGKTNPDEKLQALYAFCVDEIKNIHSDRAGYSAREKEELRENDSAAEVLRHGYGDGYYINALFGSLAVASGFEARFALCSDRSRYFFTRQMAFWSALPDLLVAVRPKGSKKDEDWKFFDPGTSYLPFGALHWTNEFSTALLGDGRETRFLSTPKSAADDSAVTRRAELALNTDGTLTGTVRIIYTGHLATFEKLQRDHETANEREEAIENELREYLPEAEISNFAMENVLSGLLPLEIRFDLRVPHYADRTSTRLFLEPAVFQHGNKPVFEKSERESVIYFPFLWNEHDSLTIALPEGYELEEAAAPKGVVDAGALRHRIRMSYHPVKRELTFERTMALNTYHFSTDIYSEVKAVFDAIDRQDHHLVTLQKVEAAAPNLKSETEPADEAGPTSSSPADPIAAIGI